ncbi:MAG: mechanosensitive ion channel family protein [Kiritimatiellia bacterium]
METYLEPIKNFLLLLDWEAISKSAVRILIILILFRIASRLLRGFLKQMEKRLKEDPIIGDLMLEEPEIFGVDNFDDSAVVIKGRIKTKPVRQWQVGREYLRRIKYAFDENNIEIPFPHTSLYVGEDSKPFEIHLLNKLKT